MAEEMADLREQHEDLEDYVETIDSDLATVEEVVYEDEEDDDDYVEVECPNCHEQVCFDAAILDEEDPIEVTCPCCNAVVYDSDEDRDDFCGCGCGCDCDCSCGDDEDEE